MNNRSRVLTKGDIPWGNSGSCAVILDDALYVFGGFQENRELMTWTEEMNVSDLHRLDLRTLTWKKLNPSGIRPLPCDKLVGWTYQGKLYFFGGFGPAPENILNIPFQFVPSADDEQVRGWNNQLLCYNPDANEWSWPQTRGPIPSPRAAHAGDICNGVVYMFGGRLKDSRMDSLHSLDMETMRWSPNLNMAGESSPRGRSWHSFTFINNNVAVMYGGFSDDSMILNDCWQLKLPSLKWELVSYTTEPRLWHCGVFMKDMRTLVLAGGHRTSILLPLSEDRADGMESYHIRLLNLPLLCILKIGWLVWSDDCWFLRINGKMIDWEEMVLAYDHGHPRCWHAACKGTPGELLIHGGIIQPFYQISFLIQEHAKDLLKLNFEPKSLLRLCLIVAVENFKQTMREWHELPAQLRAILESRLEQI